MAKIKSPVEGYTGVVVGVQFTDGEAETDRESALAYFRRQGYGIEEAAPAKAATDAKSKGKDQGDPTSAQLKARAKELGLSTSGKKDEIAARIAEHEAKEPPHAPPAEPNGDENVPNPPSTPPTGDGAGSVREA